MIRVKVKNRRAAAIPYTPVTTGAVGIPVSFTFSEDWDGLTKIAVFKGSGTMKDVALFEDECVVPWEVLTTPHGLLEIGVYGANTAGTIVIPTVWADAGQIERGTEPSESDPSDPTPSWAIQVQEAAATAGAANALVSEGYAVGKQDGTDVGSGSPYYQNNSKYFAGQAAGSATAAGNAQTAAETAQGKAEDAQTAAETAQGKAEDAQTAAETAQGLAETAQGKAEDAQDAAENAQTAAEAAQDAAEAAQDAAEAAQEAIENMTVSSETLAADESATVTKTVDEETGIVNLEFGIPKGTTFTPSIASNGDISWTNDGDLSNPATRNVRGATFTPSVSATGDISWTNDKNLDNPTSRNIRGATFTPSVDTDGDISWTNDKGLTNPTTRNIKGPKGDTGNVYFATFEVNPSTGILTMTYDENYSGANFQINEYGYMEVVI